MTGRQKIIYYAAAGGLTISAFHAIRSAPGWLAYLVLTFYGIFVSDLQLWRMHCEKGHA